jgi:two-component system chemotaxis response regulator CheB
MAPLATSPRVLVTDDSALMRRVLSDGLSRFGISVVGEAGSGDQALDLCRELRPDVVTLDLAMPGMDGVGVLRALRSAGSLIPVVVVSSFSNSARAVEALAEGAVELVSKPNVGDSLSDFMSDLASKLRIAAIARLRVRNTSAAKPPPTAAQPGSPRAAAVKKVTVIACSTGGPKALADVVPKLPPRLGSGTVIVQHMPAGFTASLAERLDKSSKIRVAEAADGERLDPGTAWLAPGGSHLRLGTDGLLRLSNEPPVGGLRPRADLTIHDAAGVFGDKLLLVVLTGMGRDGLEGAQEVKRRGGLVIAEAESSCVVFGMPRAVIERGLADVVVPLPDIAAAVTQEAGE